jgi:hypothetical protein
MTRHVFEVGDVVECVDDSPGTMNPVAAYEVERKNKSGKVKKVTVPAILVKGKTYKVVGVTAPPHDGPDLPLVQLDLPKPHDLSWWKNWRFAPTGKRKAEGPVKKRRFKKKGK